MTKRVGILGGTFDPPHFGHLIIANEVLQQLNLDEIQFLPNYKPPHKLKASSTTAEQRVEMLKIAIKNNQSFSIETIEIERKGTSYTFDIMRELKRRNPEVDYYFIIGADMVESLSKWYKIDDLSQMVQFVGVSRPGYLLKSEYPIITIEVPLIEISSSSIRNKCEDGKSVQYFLPDKVIRYMKENHLYGL